MKTLYLVSLVNFITLFIFMGCDKDDKQDASPDPQFPADLQVDISYSNDTVPEGGSVTFVWTSNAKTCFVLYYAQKIDLPQSGTKSFVLTSECEFVFTFEGEGMETKSLEFRIYVTSIIVNPAPTISVIADPTNVPYGGTSTITLSSANADHITVEPDLPGFNGETSGSFVTPELTEDITYVFTAFGNDQTTSKAVTITAEELMTNTDVISWTPWIVDTVWKKTHENDPWVTTLAIGIYTMDHYHIFAEDGWASSYYEPTNTLANYGPWSFLEDETVFKWGDQFGPIVQLDSTAFKFWKEIPGGFLKLSFRSYDPQ
ncbi:MAG: hypothetical protein JXA03_12180 [Bacteroidales bacterium]|nr:hypothetical protein [Bacteroidales bacterium]